MSNKICTQIPALPPNARMLIEQPEILLQTLNLLASALFGKTITNVDMAGSLALQENPTAYTIASGIITLQEGIGQNVSSRSSVAVDTEGGAASDDLDTINGGRDGMVLVLRAADTTHTVVVKNGTGNIVLPADVSLDTDDVILILHYNSTKSKWLGYPALIPDPLAVDNLTERTMDAGITAEQALIKDGKIYLSNQTDVYAYVDAFGSFGIKHSTTSATIMIESSGTNNMAVIQLYPTGTGESRIVYSNVLELFSAGIKAKIDANGNFGIGLSSMGAKLQVNGGVAIVDGMTAPDTISGYAQIYVDAADGDLKVKFGDGTVKTITVDT